MDFSLTSEQAALKDSIARFARDELNAGLAERDEARAFNAAGWKRCAEMGIQGLGVPARYGGKDADPITVIAALEGLGYGCEDNGLCFALNAHMWGCMSPLLAFGSERQKEHFLPGLSSGRSVGALAMSEPEAGSDAYAVKTTARRHGEHYVLEGHKIFVTNGPIADVTIVLATVDAAKGAHGVSAFLVEKAMAGAKVLGPIPKMGLNGAQMGELELRDCRIPVESRLGAEGAGLALFHHAMEWERGFILAAAVGAMQRQLEQCRRHVRSRRQFGRAIGSFQLVSTKLVDMHMRVETARLLLYKFGWLKAHERRAAMEAAMVKLHISEAWVQSCQDAIQLYGGYGYLKDTTVERDLRDAIASRIYSGTSEIQREVIAQWLGLS